MAVFPSLCVSLSVCLSPSVSVWTKDCRSVCLFLSLSVFLSLLPTYIYLYHTPAVDVVIEDCSVIDIEKLSPISLSLYSVYLSLMLSLLSLFLFAFMPIFHSLSACLSDWLVPLCLSYLFLSVSFFHLSVCLSLLTLYLFVRPAVDVMIEDCTVIDIEKPYQGKGDTVKYRNAFFSWI